MPGFIGPADLGGGRIAHGDQNIATGSPRPPRIAEAQIRLLERLCNACAVSGNEDEVRKIVLEQVKAHADEVRVDGLGNVLAIRKGTGSQRLRVMVAAHMDEVGMMLIDDEGEGIFRFDMIGGLDAAAISRESGLGGQRARAGSDRQTAAHLG